VGLGEESARRDIFPSLHTALPTYLTIASFLNRRERPFRWVWPPMALVTSQIILATMFLRWHYLVDVVAGLTLAVTAAAGARRMAPAEARSRAQFGVAPVWRPLFPRRARLRVRRPDPP
jgi:membrane-associated phospholipid phosphatase